MMKSIEIYTDGACLGNPGPGGWAALLRENKNEKEISGYEADTTNNRMELMAAISALETLTSPHQVQLYTDSQYVCKGITEWLENWQRNHWKTTNGEPVKNQELWRRLQTACQQHVIDWRWIKGHAGHADNERVDQLARHAALLAQPAQVDNVLSPKTISPATKKYTLRQIVLDTETTGLEWQKGNRIVEIGAVELCDRRLTGNQFHRYLKPDCAFEAGAQQVTGLSLKFLDDKPRFEDIADEFLAWVEGAELIIHNASFDMGFLENELARAGKPRLAERVKVIDTLQLARARYPGQRNSLDALCKRLGVDNSDRQLHGGLLDARILAKVYIALTSGQEEIGFNLPAAPKTLASDPPLSADVDTLPPRPAVHVRDAERQAHEARLDELRKKAGTVFWDQLMPTE